MVRDKQDLRGVGALATSSLITISRKFKQADLTKAARPRFTSLRSAELGQVTRKVRWTSQRVPGEENAE